MRYTILVAIGTLLLSACGPVTFVVGIAPGQQNLTQTPIASLGPDKSADHKIAVVDVSGVIVNANKPGVLSQGENPVSVLTEMLAKAQKDTSVRAVVLRINSPGGAVTASDAMYRELLRFREASRKPVVAVLMDVAASGGYYVACGADEIVAYPTSITASIGVLVQTVSVKPALERIGVRVDTIRSGPNKAVTSPLHVMSDDERKIIESMVDQFYQRFVDVVRNARPIDEATLLEVADGRIVTGAQAAAIGLADATGDVFDAGNRAMGLAGLESAKLVVYHRPIEHVGSVYAQAGQGASTDAGQTGRGTQINIGQVNLASSPFDPGPMFHYLWQPTALR